MPGLGDLPSVLFMVKSLRWQLVLGLGSLALIRPLTSIVEYQLDVSGPAAVPITITLVVTAVWVGVVGLAGTPRPVLTLVAAGLTYAVLSIVLSGNLSPILTGELQGPLAMPLAIIPVLLVNAVWGLIAGRAGPARQAHPRHTRTPRTTPFVTCHTQHVVTPLRTPLRRDKAHRKGCSCADNRYRRPRSHRRRAVGPRRSRPPGRRVPA